MQTLPARHANLHFVTEELAIDGDIDPTWADAQLAELDAPGITRVIDCGIEWNNDEPLFARRLPHVSVRSGTDPQPDLLRLQQWRAGNPMDVVRIIRAQRELGL